MKKTNLIYIIFSVFILNYFMLIPAAFAATNVDANQNFILQEEQIKHKINEAIGNLGRKLVNRLVKSLGISAPASSQGNASANMLQSSAVKGKKIVIDPGHGGSNPGAVRYDLRESDNNLAVGLKVKKLLEDQGATVVMTRTSDATVAKKGAALKDELQARVDIAHNNGADALISIHTNSNENTAIKGAMTFYYHDASKALAKAVQEQLVKATGAADKGIDHGNFLVLRNSKIPAILVEMGFITNYEEAMKLNEDAYRNKMAAGIANGIGQYFSKK